MFKSSRGRSVIVWFLWLLVLSPQLLFSQADPVARTIAVAAVPDHSESEHDSRSERIGRILERSIILELERSGREALPAENEKAPYVLVSTYAVGQNELEFVLSLRHSESAGTLAQTTRRTQVGLHLDTVVSEAVKQVVSDAGFPARVEPLLAPAPSPPATTTSVPSPEPATPTRTVPEVTAGLEATASVAPMFVTGSGTDFFKYGLVPLLYAGYRFPFLNGAGSAGLQTGYSLVFPDEDVLEASVRVVPVGIEVSYSTVSPTGIRFTGHASGGPAVISVTREDIGTLSKLLFYVRTGVGGSIEVSRRISVGIDASYTLFFEEQFPLMGFSPALTVRMRL
jgi:hypothetical protein